MHITIFGTSMNWLAQLFDIIGFIIIAVAYQQKKKAFLIVSVVSYVFFVLEALSILLIDGINTYANIIVTGFGIIRNLIMIIYAVKKDKEMPVWIALVILAGTWGLNIFFFGEWYTYIPCVAVTIYTLSAIQKNYYLLKVGAMINESAYIVYNLAVGGYAGVIREIILVMIIIFSVINMAIKDGYIKLPDFAAIKLKMQYTIEDRFYKILESNHSKHLAHHHKI